MYIKVRSGVITSCKIFISAENETARIEEEAFHRKLVDKALQDIVDFKEVLKPPPASQICKETHVVAGWLNRIFGNRVG